MIFLNFNSCSTFEVLIYWHFFWEKYEVIHVICLMGSRRLGMFRKWLTTSPLYRWSAGDTTNNEDTLPLLELILTTISILDSSHACWQMASMFLSPSISASTILLPDPWLEKESRKFSHRLKIFFILGTVHLSCSFRQNLLLGRLSYKKKTDKYFFSFI